MSENKFIDYQIWESKVDNPFKIIEEFDEQSGLVDGKFILARVEGPAFFPETVSRNNIFYSLAAWENAVEDDEFQKRLADGLVFGTIGHDSELDDNDIRDGKFSHKTTKVWIEDGEGRAEYLIYGTEPGKRLNMLLRTGSKLRVSTKAEGFFQKHPGNSGTKAVIPENFRLDRIDFVIDPGYHEALPSVVESLSEDNQTTNFIKKGNTMSDINENYSKVEKILESRIDELKSEKSISESVAKDLQVRLSEINEAHSAVKNKLAIYESIGTAAAIQEVYALLAQYEQIGSPQHIREALEEGEEVVNDLTGTIEDLQSKIDDDDDKGSLESNEEYEELGQPGDIKAALDQALVAIDELKEYKELGSLEEIQQLIDKSGEMAEDMESEENKKVAEKFGVDESVINDLLEKGFDLDDIESLLGKIKEPASDVTEDDDEEEEETTDADALDGGKTEEDDDLDTIHNVPESKSSKALSKLINSQRPSTISESKSTRPGKDKPLVARLMNQR